MGGEFDNPYADCTMFQKNGQDSFLIISSEENSVLPYQLNMIRYNSIDGMLPVNFLIEEGTYRYFYTISSKEALSGRMKGKKYTIREIRTVMTRLYELCGKMEEYLLETDSIILHPDYIYTDKSFTHVFFCFYPDKKSSFDEDLSKLLEYFMNHLDYQDENSVKVTYSLYQEVRQENYSLDELMKRFCESREQTEDQFSDYQKDNRGGRTYSGSKKMQSEMETGELSEKPEPENRGKNMKKGKLLENKKSASIQVSVGSFFPWFLISAFGMAVLYAAGYYLLFRKETLVKSDYIIYAVFAIGVVLLCLLFMVQGEDKTGKESHSGSERIGDPMVEKWDKQNENRKDKRKDAFNEYRDDPRKESQGDSRNNYPDENRNESRNEYRSGEKHAYRSEAENDYRHLQEMNLRPEREPSYAAQDTIQKQSDKWKRSIKTEIPEETGFEEFSYDNRGIEQMEKRKIPATLILDADENGNVRDSVFVSRQKNKAQDFRVDKDNLIVGKLPGVANVCIYEPAVSRVHARIVKENNKCYLIDLGSTNGTFINGKKMREREKVLLNHQDVVAFADVEYSFQM